MSLRTRKNADDYHGYLGLNGYYITIAANFPLIKAQARWRARSLRKVTKEHTISTKSGVKLAAHITDLSQLNTKTQYPQHQSDNSKLPLLAYIHGWGGSHGAVYILNNVLDCKKKSEHNQRLIARINLVDHGNTAHLNQEGFHANNSVDYLADALIQLHEQTGRKVHLLGFSLGGNIALRTAARLAQTTSAQPLQTVAAISPTVSLETTSKIIFQETGYILRWYFQGKFNNMIKAKTKYWPDSPTVRDILVDPPSQKQPKEFFSRRMKSSSTSKDPFTNWAKLYHNEDIASYYQKGQLTSSHINDIDVPLFLVSAQDDPCCPISELNAILTGVDDKNNFTIFTPEKGGHCGFLESPLQNSWAGRKHLDWILKNE